MSDAPSKFRQIAGFDQLSVARSGKLNCFAFALRTGDFCLYSPVAGLAKVDGAVQAEPGAVSMIFAPNHYHNKGLKPYSDLLPDATLVCSDLAKPRLRKQTGLDFASMDVLNAALPENMQLLQPEGLKTGEVWLQVQHGQRVAWLVTDAFSGAPRPEGEFNTAPTMLGTFPKFGIKHARTYRDWLEKRISVQPPTHLLPCHGSLVQNASLGAALITVLEDSI